MKIFSALETQYSKLDSAIRAYVSSVLGAQSASYSSSNVFGMILNVIRGIWQNALLYLEDAVQEQNIKTATRMQSIFSLAKLSGYEPFYGYAAQGILTMSPILNNLSEDTHIVIPNRTKVQHTGTGKLYTINLPYDYLTYTMGGNYKTINLPILQGNFMTSSWTATGTYLESFSVSMSAYYDINHVTVKVNGEEWHKYECLYDIPAGEKGYLITQAFDGEFQIVLGNNVHGTPAPKDATVTCEYLTHRGEYGNISATQGDKFIFYDSLKNIDGDSIDGNELFTLTKSGPVSGGIDAESIKQVRYMTGYNSRSCVLANADNYKLFLHRFSFVGQNNVWSDTNSMTVNISILTNVANNITNGTQYFNLNKADFLLSSEQKNIIKTTIENSKLSFAGTELQFIDPILRNFALILYVKKEPDIESDALKADIHKCLGRYFAEIKDSTSFIPKSDIIKLILTEVNGITSVDLRFISETNETAYDKHTYTSYEKQWINGTYKIVKSEKVWNDGLDLCLDTWANIKLSTLLEFPILLGGFRYWPNKNNRNESIMLDAVNIFFV